METDKRVRAKLSKDRGNDMILEEYAKQNPFTGSIQFSIWDAKRRRVAEGFCGSGSLTDPVFVRNYNKKVRKAEITAEGRLILEVFLKEEKSPKLPKIETKDIKGKVKMRKECLLEEVDEALEEFYEAGEYDSYEFKIDEFDDGMISLESIKITIPELELYVYQGCVCVYDPDEEEYMPDFSITAVYEINEEDPKKYLYWEQDGIQVSLYNFLRSEKTMDNLGSLKCIIEVEGF